jgi:hypothetical protein
MTKKLHIIILFFLFSTVILLSNSGTLAVPVTSSSNNQTGKFAVTNFVEKGLELYNASNYEQAL